MKLGILGTGMIVKDVLTMYHELGVEKTYLFSTKKSKSQALELMKKYHLDKVYTDYDELLQSDVDTIYCALPNHLHYEFSKKALENDKNVIIEKPITANSKELEDLIETANKKNLMIFEAMNLHYIPAFLSLKEDLKKLGDIKIVSFNYSQYSSRYNKFKNGIVENAFNPKFSNGAIMDIGVYCVHPMVKLFGMPEQIDASAIILPDSIDGEGTISLKYKDMLADITYSKISNGFTPSEIQGEKGAILIEAIDSPRRVIVRYNDGTTEEVYNVELDNNLVFEAKEWETMINSHDYSDKHSKYSLMALQIMDKARAIQGIVFPADKKH